MVWRRLQAFSIFMDVVEYLSISHCGMASKMQDLCEPACMSVSCACTSFSVGPDLRNSQAVPFKFTYTPLSMHI
jgi:hypothetical protein